MRPDSETAFLKTRWKMKDTTPEMFSGRQSAQREDLPFWVGRAAQLKAWRDELTSLGQHRSYNSLNFIVGSYGRGKTLALLRIEYEATASVDPILPVYITFVSEAGKKPLDFVLRILETIDFASIGNKYDTPQLVAALAAMPDCYRLFARVFAALLGIPVAFASGPARDTDDFAAGAIQPSIVNQKRELAKMWIAGQGINHSQMEEIGVLGRLNRVDTALKCLCAARVFLKSLGYRALVISVDEFEYLFGIVGRKSAPQFFALIRSLYDAASPDGTSGMKMANLGLFIAISEPGWQSLTEMKRQEGPVGGPVVPLLDRAGSQTLTSLTRDETRETIALRLRSSPSKAASSPIIPFTDDFVDYVYRAAIGTPRFILFYCDLVLRRGLEQHISLLTAAFASEVLSEIVPRNIMTSDSSEESQSEANNLREVP